MRASLFALLCAFAVPTVIVSAPTAAQAKKKGLKKLKKKANKAAKPAKNMGAWGKKGDKRRVHIKNCSGRKAVVCIYNGNDGFKVFARKRRTLVDGKDWKVGCASGDKVLGNGKKCKVLVVEDGLACPLDAAGPEMKQIWKGRTAYIGLDDRPKFKDKPSLQTPLKLKLSETTHCESRP